MLESSDSPVEPAKSDMPSSDLVRFSGLNWWKQLTFTQTFTLVLFIALLTIQVGPLLSLGNHLLNVDYFQHFPLLVFAAVVTAVLRIRKDGFSFSGEVSIRFLFWMVASISLCILLYSLPSRWLVAPAAFTWLLALITFVGGKKLRMTLADSMWFALICIPPPSTFGNRFMLWLQNISTTLASYWLDAFNIYHNTTGVSIQTPQNSYLVKDACSGIQSVFAAIAVGVLFGVARGYGFARMLTVIGPVVCWVIAANALRIFLMLYLKENHKIDFTEGTPHEIAGVITFLVGVGLAISGDYFIRFLFPPFVAPETDANGEAITNEKVELTEEEIGRSWLDVVILNPWPLRIVGLVVIAAFVGVLGFGKLDLPANQVVKVSELLDRCCIDIQRMNEEFLPLELDGWRRSAYEKEEQGEDSVFGGLVSHRWLFVHPDGRRVVLSIDGPYESWHDLTTCYQGLGWNLVETDTSRYTDEQLSLEAYELDLQRGGVDFGHSLFLCWDETGRNVQPPENLGPSVTTLWAKVQGLLGETKPIQGGAIQLQLFSLKPSPLSILEREQNEKLLWEAAKVLQSNFKKQSAAPEGT